VFRHFAEEKNLAYKKTSEFTQGERERFIEKVRLPGSRTGEFKKDAFEKAINVVMDTWNHLFIDIERKDPDGSIAYIKNWNLDTGTDENEQYFWP
jgi:hypothetical protein